MESLKVSDYMNPRPVTFTRDMTVALAVEIIAGAPDWGPGYQ